MIDSAKRSALSARSRLTTVAMLALSAAACSGDDVPTSPDYAYVKVTVLTSGADLDANGYTIVVDALQPRKMAGDSLRALESFYLSPGTHGIMLDNVAANCTVKGANPRTVTAVTGLLAEVAFEVACLPTGVAVTTRTTGPDSPDALSLVVNEQPPTLNEALPMKISANGSRIVGRLKPGSYAVSLIAPKHCTVAGANSITVGVTTNTATPVAFEISCVPATRLEKIAYVDGTIAGESGGGVLAVVNVDGTGAEFLQAGNSPSWSPGRTQLAFTTTVCYADYYYPYCTGGLELIDPETGNVVELSRGFGFHPSWSRSGTAIAFEIGPGLDDQELAILDLPSSSRKTLTIAGPSSKERPAFSPDEKRIAFTCRWGAITDLCIVDADGTNLERLTNDVQVDDHAAWSPDGTRIAFTRYFVSSDEASAEILVMDLATSRITTLTTGLDAAWSPDGSKLVFAGGDGLFVIGADGSNRVRLTTGAHRAPGWRP